MTTHSLTGKNHLNINNLKGVYLNETNNIPVKIKKLKERILEDYLLPLFTKKWNTLNENVFFIETLQKNISYYYNIYKIDELNTYHELLKVIKILIDNYQTLENYESQTKTKFNPNQVTSFIFKTAKIQLLPEYEIYDSIIGKPKKELKEKYDIDMICLIKKLIEQENMTYNKIKEHIKKETTQQEIKPNKK
jgi:hypothetical protein